MASSFTVTPTPPTTLKLALGETGMFRFTVTSLAAPDKIQDVMLRAFLVGRDGKREEVDWLTAEPTQPLMLTGGKTEIATVVARPTAKSPRGENAIQLAIFDDDRPNDAFTFSTPVTCDVIGPAEGKAEPVAARLPSWLIPALAAAGALAIAAIVFGWVASRSAAQQVRTPAGAIIAFGGRTPPDGWLLCDGAEISRTDDSALFAAVGTAWGGGNGTTTFNLPDLRGFFLRGADEAGVRDPGAKKRISTAGAAAVGVGSLQGRATAMPNNPFSTAAAGAHQHTAPTFTGAAGPFEVPGGGFGFDYIGGAPVSTAGEHSHAMLGGDEETRPINVAVNYIIKR